VYASQLEAARYASSLSREIVDGLDPVSASGQGFGVPTAVQAKLGESLNVAFQLTLHLLQPVGVNLAHVVEHHLQGPVRLVIVKRAEAEQRVPLRALVVRAHPLEQGHNFVGVHPVSARQLAECERIVHCPLPGLHVSVDGVRPRPAQLHGHYAEPLLQHQTLNDAVLHGEELTCAVGGFAQGHDACIPDHLHERTQILASRSRHRRVERDRVRFDPCRDLCRDIGRLGTNRTACVHEYRTAGPQQHNSQ